MERDTFFAENSFQHLPSNVSALIKVHAGNIYLQYKIFIREFVIGNINALHRQYLTFCLLKIY